ncbi:MAG: hypothetical protein JNL70_02880 [Saprospiraceae bacterium]|nr:hypothetical protein [Saprospiraceae bacterium]
MNLRLTKLLIFGFVLEVVVLLLSYFESNGNTTLFFQAAARLSGRVSLLFFIIYAFFATRFHKSDKPSVSEVKHILVSDFAIIHLIHWVLLVVAVKLSGFELVPYRLAGGALAYIMVVSMPYVYAKKLFSSVSTIVLEHIYITYVWLIFLMTYVPRLQGKVPTATGSTTAYWILLGFVVLFMLWRMVVLMLRKEKN